jgi:CheY-like chemotaxis protein
MPNSELLLVEDNPGDVRLTMEALTDSQVINIHVVSDGAEAIAFLRREGNYVDVPQPDLILLDLNLPRKDGREVLAELKKDENLRHIPVIVLTTSSSESDIEACYELHANCYITKPTGLQSFSLAIKSIQDFWTTTAILSPKKE